MKKSFLKVIILFFVIILITEISLAATSINRPFGGKVTSSGEAKQILTLEAATFLCIVPGTTFDIKPIRGSLPGPYIIPFGVIGRGGGTPVMNRWILGLYNVTPTIITCTQEVTGAVETVNAYTVTLYGTSYK